MHPSAGGALQSLNDPLIQTFLEVYFHLSGAARRFKSGSACRACGCSNRYPSPRPPPAPAQPTVAVSIVRHQRAAVSQRSSVVARRWSARRTQTGMKSILYFLPSAFTHSSPFRFSSHLAAGGPEQPVVAPHLQPFVC